jgi:hypothetical protein
MYINLTLATNGETVYLHKTKKFNKNEFYSLLSIGDSHETERLNYVFLNMLSTNTKVKKSKNKLTLDMAKEDLNNLDIILLSPTILLEKRLVWNYLRIPFLIHFEILYYSKNLIFAKLFVYNPINRMTFGKLFYSPNLYLASPYYSMSNEQYLKSIKQNLENKSIKFKSKESNSILKDYMLQVFTKDKFNLFENIDNLLNKF